MEFVNFELAKKLKDLGYNVPFFFFYRTDDQFIHHAMVGNPLVYGENVDNEVVIAPTISQVLNWLEVEKRIYILVEPFPSMATKDKVCWSWHFKWNSDGVNIDHTFPDDFTYLTSKEATLAAIEYALDKLIMEKQKKDYEEWFQINYLEFENNDDTWADEVEVNLGKDYEIQIRGDKTFIVKKQLQYPKTYAECCRIIVAKQDRHYYYTKKDKEQDYPNEIRILDQLDHLRMLIICRDAYWKIIGDWRPDWESSAIKYTIKYQNNNILKRTNEYINSILCFPTEEMRDAFYENFKSLIESCKELL